LRIAARNLPKESSLYAKLNDLALLTDFFTGERDATYGSLPRDLDKLRATLEKKPLFKDTAIFVSGFTSFTAGEAAVLAEIMRTGALSVSLPLPEEEESTLACEEVLATHAHLLSLADRVGSAVTQTRAHTHRPPMLAYAKSMLFRKDGVTPPYTGEYDGSLTLVHAENAYSAAACVAAKIAEAVRRGARYRDFTVITRSPEKYDGILDEALLAEGIPVFFAKEASMTDFSLAKMILSAYACLDRGFARADLIGYMKCGFTGISREDGDRLELYAETWRLKGDAFAKDTPFDMHPDGYKASFSE
jgi:ATP-dependent helicase/nuclease subunit B